MKISTFVILCIFRLLHWSGIMACTQPIRMRLLYSLHKDFCAWAVRQSPCTHRNRPCRHIHYRIMLGLFHQEFYFCKFCKCGKKKKKKKPYSNIKLKVILTESHTHRFHKINKSHIFQKIWPVSKLSLCKKLINEHFNLTAPRNYAIVGQNSNTKTKHQLKMILKQGN